MEVQELVIYVVRGVALQGLGNQWLYLFEGGGEQGGVKEELCKEACGEWHGCVHLRSQHEGQKNQALWYSLSPLSSASSLWPRCTMPPLSCAAGAGPEKINKMSPKLFSGTPLVHCANVSAALTFEVEPEFNQCITIHHVENSVWIIQRVFLGSVHWNQGVLWTIWSPVSHSHTK